MLSISNIAWSAMEDSQVWALLKQYGVHRLEAAPGRLVPEHPYENLTAAGKAAEELKKNYQLSIVGLQAILFGRQERLFGTAEERAVLMEYLKKAVLFAKTAGCSNLVFGSPKNRSYEAMEDTAPAVPFFREIARFAHDHGAVLNMEANPGIYGTNYINSTLEGAALVREVDHPGFRLNLDAGTMIVNEETVDSLKDCWPLIRHIHISEPHLEPIVPRDLHRRLLAAAGENGYKGSVSIEMRRNEKDPVGNVERAMEYMLSLR